MSDNHNASIFDAERVFIMEQMRALWEADGEEELEFLFRLTEHSYSVRKLTRQMVIVDETLREKCLEDIEIPAMLQTAAMLHDIGQFRNPDKTLKGCMLEHDGNDHGLAGFEIAKTGGITDQRVLFTIRYHDVPNNGILTEKLDSNEFHETFGMPDAKGIRLFLSVIRDANRLDEIWKFIYSELYSPYDCIVNSPIQEIRPEILDTFKSGQTVSLIALKPHNPLERLLVASSLVFDVNYRGALDIIFRNYQYRRVFSTLLHKHCHDDVFCASLEASFDKSILNSLYWENKTAIVK